MTSEGRGVRAYRKQRQGSKVPTDRVQRGSRLVEVRDLFVTYSRGTDSIHALQGVELDIVAGSMVGIVGESGSGKSTLAMMLSGRLLPSYATVGGTARVKEFDLVGAEEDQLEAYRGRVTGLVMQDPGRSLNPGMTVLRQLSEVIERFSNLTQKDQIFEEANELLDAVNLHRPRDVLRSYPHELSGGMAQRVAIALALAGSPDMLVADEPTTALDVTVQSVIFELLSSVCAERGLTLVVVSHDIALLRDWCSEIAVMYAGRVVERGRADSVVENPAHYYSAGLTASIPTLRARGHLASIPGTPPALTEILPGCAFRARCPMGAERTECLTSVPLQRTALGTTTLCHFPISGQGGVGHASANPFSFRIEGTSDQPPSPESTGELVVEAEGLVKRFRVRGTGDHRTLTAVDGVNLRLLRGETLALVGESGSGKSTLGNMLVGLLTPDEGEIRPLPNTRAKRSSRPHYQMVFQNPHSSLNPHHRVGEIVSEPLLRMRLGGAEVRRRVGELLEMVDLPSGAAGRFPHEFSGGQRQRIAIARALAPSPYVLVLDEPVSSLDTSVQASVLRVLARVQTETSVSMLLISHDIATVYQVADRIAVMRSGRIVEEGGVYDVTHTPQNEYTRSLLQAMPRMQRQTD